MDFKLWLFHSRSEPPSTMFSIVILSLSLVALLIAAIGFFILYLEGQRYTPRTAVARAVYWHAGACVVLAIGLASMAWIRKSTSEETLANQLAQLQSELTSLRAETASQKSRLTAAVQLKTQVSTLMRERRLQDEQHQSLKDEIERLQGKLSESQKERRPKKESAKLVPVLAQTLADPSEPSEAEPPREDSRPGMSTNYKALESYRTRFGNSINPLYQADQREKQEANKLIQQLLSDLEFYEGEVNGEGVATFAAVQRYQRTRGLPETGIIAEKTVRVLWQDCERSTSLAANHSW